ncbi:MAG: hypothetical protein ABFC84_05330 [Veillonellales bacterium]
MDDGHIKIFTGYEFNITVRGDPVRVDTISSGFNLDEVKALAA